MSFDLLLFHFPNKVARVNHDGVVSHQHGFFFFFFFKNFILVLFIIDILTLVLIFLISNFCSWSFCKKNYLFLISSFNPNLSCIIFFFDPYFFDF